MKKNNYTSIESIINIAKKGGMFILVDDEKRENEGDLIISTTDSSAKNINFMAKYGRGLICLALDSVQAKRLNLSLMSPINQSRNKTELKSIIIIDYSGFRIMQLPCYDRLFGQYPHNNEQQQQ